VTPGRAGMLSIQENEVLRLLANGMTIGEVAPIVDSDPKK
jgi:DNA-binding CsgD family transcriptional regulator